MTPELKAKIQAKREERLKWYTPTARAVVKRAWGGKSRKAALKAFCLECVGCERKLITECTAYACPLWEYRPYQTPDEDDSTAEK